jgi:hypothetical protein
MLVTRTFRSAPFRDSAETWNAIVDLLTRVNEVARQELSLTTGIASSCIADQAAKTAPIIVTCDGPRTRVYCIYDEDALDESDANETALGFDPLNGNWSVSLPCRKEDLAWVRSGLKKYSSRISARDLALGIEEEKSSRAPDANRLTLNIKGFLGQ